jgi:uncharacterized YigZ family protein
LKAAVRSDSQLVPAGDGKGELREKASRFLGFARRVSSEAEARSWISSLDKKFHDATHVCFAWKIGSRSRAADSGEPPGTAGKPILAAIGSAGLDEACVVVVRYFGGTKLGTAGLVRCYRETARLALEKAGSEEVFETETLELVVPYERVSEVKGLVDPPHVVLVEEEFTDDARFKIRVRKSRLEQLKRTLRAASFERRNESGPR